MENFFAYIDKGGLIFIFLFFLSLITVSIIIFKILEIYFFNKMDFSKELQIIENHNTNSENIVSRDDLLSNTSNSKRKFLQNLFLILDTGKPKNILEEEINIVVGREFKKIQKFLPSLEIIAQASPLVGLLGTVIGMIDSFNELEIGGSLVDPSILAGGIWTALLTTAMGLIVAIPALVSNYFFEKKINFQYENVNILLKKLIFYP